MAILPKAAGPKFSKYVEMYLEGFEDAYFSSLRIDKHCMHTCFAGLLRNRNGEVHLTLKRCREFGFFAHQYLASKYLHRLAFIHLYIYLFFVQRFTSYDSALHHWSSIYVLGNIGY